MKPIRRLKHSAKISVFRSNDSAGTAYKTLVQSICLPLKDTLSFQKGRRITGTSAVFPQI